MANELTPGTNDLYTQAILDYKRIAKLTYATLTTPTALDTDVSDGSTVYAYLQNSTGNITSWTLSNPTQFQELVLMVGRSAAQTVVWPTNIKWADGVAPTPNQVAGSYAVVRLVYINTDWFELSRTTASAKVITTIYSAAVANQAHVLNEKTVAFLASTIGAGQGGASGRRGLSSEIRAGGGSGSGGGLSEQFLRVSDLTLTARTLYVDVGAGGAGGAAVTADNTNGNPGGVPSRHTSVKINNSAASSSNVLACSYAGVSGPGGGGLGVAGAAGQAQYGKFMGAAGTASAAAGTIGGNNVPVVGGAGSGGGSGGGLTAANVASNGGVGGYSLGLYPTPPAGGTGGGQGTDGATPAVLHAAGWGGGGGASAAAAAAGRGGHGSRGCGGGGGGASTNGFNSGAGGNGGDGSVMIVEHIA